jgi:hypothetical protein
VSAEVARFTEWLQQPVDAGCITPAGAWTLEWEVCIRTFEPWDAEAWNLNQRVALFHAEQETMTQ